MTDVTEVLTERLRLRTWTDDDRPAFAGLNADPEVMRHLPAVLDRAGSDALMDRIRALWAERGVDLWAVERRADGVLLGWAGLHPMPEGTPGAGEWEVGWRLARAAWGRGYATEAAREGVRVARALGVPRLWSMTVPANVRSIAVMRRLGMVEQGHFDHPRFEPGHRLRDHVAYVLDLRPRPEGDPPE
jgi:RimJ/RimL family protein N-acetyltransferase